MRPNDRINLIVDEAEKALHSNDILSASARIVKMFDRHNDLLEAEFVSGVEQVIRSCSDKGPQNPQLLGLDATLEKSHLLAQAIYEKSLKEYTRQKRAKKR